MDDYYADDFEQGDEGLFLEDPEDLVDELEEFVSLQDEEDDNE